MINNEYSSKIYALLIGIDCYLPNRLSDGSVYRSLQGAVRDANAVEIFLKEMRKIPQERIVKLTASNPTDSDSLEPIEPPEQWPTYKNIVAQFKALTELAVKNDQVYIHYSGHGGRTITLVPEVKGENGTDESLVPTDIGQPDGNYLRDIELAKLLQEMVDKGLIVTLILDSCHSGGATRGNTAIRGLDIIDETPRAQKSLVAPIEELAHNWEVLTQQSTRGLNSGWLPESRNYVILAACRPNEYAYETTFNGSLGERNGALTYWLLDTLKQQTPPLTYKGLYERVHAKVHSQFTEQTPMLLGEGNREVFGSKLVQLTYAVSVIDIDLEKQRVLLETGQVAGMRKGAEFAIYPQGTENYFKPQERLAIAQIVEYGATQSWCSLEPISGKKAVQAGDQAILISASVNLVRSVLLFYQEKATAEELALQKMLPNKLPPEIYQMQDYALQIVKDALPDNSWVEVRTKEEEEGEISYVVTLNEKGEYEICDRAGTPYPNLRHPLKAGTFYAARQLVKRLVHLAKYHAIAELDNFDRNSPLMDKLEVEWLGTLSHYDPADPIPKKSKLELLDDFTNPTIAEGEWIFLRVCNNSHQDLNIAVLDLESDWSVEQVHPASVGEKFIPLSPGQKEDIPFRLSLPEDYKEGTDVAKVFATVGEPNFRWLELPSLDEPLQTKGMTRSPRGLNPLEELLTTFDDEQPRTRRLNPAQYPSREWTTKQVIVTVKKNKCGHI